MIKISPWYPSQKGAHMEITVITIFCVVDDFLKAIKFYDDMQARMSSAEVMTTVIVAGKFFGGHQDNARKFLKDHYYIPAMLSKSQLNRRIHAIGQNLWEQLAHILAQAFISIEGAGDYVHDSFPVPVCSNARMNRCKILKGQEYLGYSATKNEYFFGIRVHMNATKFGGPVEYRLAPGSYHDSRVVKDFEFDLPENSTIHADNGCADMNYEEVIAEGTGTVPIFHRRSNAKNPHLPWVDFLSRRIRKRVETTFSVIQGLFPKKIHAVTAAGFFIKVNAFIAAYSLTL